MSGAASRLGERSAATTPTEAVDQTTPEVVEPSFNRRLARWLPHIISFVLFALAIVVIHRELAPYRPADLFDRLAQIPASAITLALIAAALGYGTLTLFDPLALQYLGKRLPYRRTALASFTGYAFSHNLGLGWLSGGAVRYRLYTAWGLSSLDIGMVLAFNTVTTFLGLGSILALACLGEPDEIAVILRIPQPVVVVLGLALGVAVAGYVALAATRRSPIGFAGWQLDMPRPAIAAAQIALSLLDWALAAAVLYVLLPAGLAFGFMSFVGLFGLANLGGLISNVPGGIGVFEAVVLLAVPDGGASGAVAAALIGYRLIYYLLPLVVAALLLGGHQFLATGELARRVGSWALILAPNLFALIVFVAGIMLLATGASPTIASRMEALAEVVPARRHRALALPRQHRGTAASAGGLGTAPAPGWRVSRDAPDPRGGDRLQPVARASCRAGDGARLDPARPGALSTRLLPQDGSVHRALLVRLVARGRRRSCLACSGWASSAIGTSSTATICGGASWPRRMRLDSCGRRPAR